MSQEWRCRECNTLLGVNDGSRIQLRYKQAQYVVEGGHYTVTAVCRSCHTVNLLDVGGDGEVVRQSS